MIKSICPGAGVCWKTPDSQHYTVHFTDKSSTFKSHDLGLLSWNASLFHFTSQFVVFSFPNQVALFTEMFRPSLSWFGNPRVGNFVGWTCQKQKKQSQKHITDVNRDWVDKKIFKTSLKQCTQVQPDTFNHPKRSSRYSIIISTFTSCVSQFSLPETCANYLNPWRSKMHRRLVQGSLWTSWLLSPHLR